MSAPHDPTRSVSGDSADHTRSDPAHTNSLADAAATTGGERSPPVAAPAPVATGRYELHAEIARGGMGVVYRATDTHLGREVAVKVLQEKFGATSAAARRFADEAHITGQLQHPGIPPVHDLGTLADGRPFLAMKLIKGRTLSDQLSARPDPAHDRGRFVAVFEQVCQAVAYAHAHGVIHRDLKPANVMVGAFGEVQVMDWGLAKVLAGPAKTEEPTECEAGVTDIRLPGAPDQATQAGSVLGTPSYMSPEQSGGEISKVDERSDVFGLGAVLCAVLTGQPPYTGAASKVRLMAVRGATGAAFARLDGCGADPELVGLCKRCLATDREERPAHAGELAKAVTAHLVATEERARRAELDRITTEEKRKRRRVQVTLALTVVGLVAATGGGLALTSLWRRAEGAKQDADVQRLDADAQRRTADGLRAEADRQRLLGRKYLYYSRVSLASRAWNDAQIHRLDDLMEQERTQPPGEDPRGFEWHYLWRARHGPEYVLLGHTDHAESVDWSSDGKLIASGARDTTVRLWAVDAPDPVVRILKGHTGRVLVVAFSPDGTRLATASTDRTAKIWDVKTGTEVKTITAHAGFVTSVSWSPDGTALATSSWDKTVRVWDARTWAQTVVFKGHGHVVDGVSFSPDGTHVASASPDLTVKVWNARTGAEKCTCIGHTHNVTRAFWSPDGKRLASSAGDQTIRIWNAETGREEETLRGHTGGVWDVRFSPDGARLVSAGSDGTVRIWARGARFVEQATFRGHKGDVKAVKFSPDGARCVSASFDKTVRVWNTATDPDSLVLRGHRNWVWGVAFSPDGRNIVSASLDQTAKVWDGSARQEPRTVLGHSGFVIGAAYSPDGARLATCSMDHTVKIWNAATGQEERPLSGHRQPVFCVSFTPDGKHVVSASGAFWYSEEGIKRVPAEVKVWRVSDGSEVASFKGHAGGVSGLAISSDGGRVATASFDGTVRIWEPMTGRQLVSMKWASNWPSAVAFRPGGKQLATGSADGTVHIWDAATGQEIKRFQGHSEDILSIAYSPDGTRLATGSHDTTLKIWDPELGYEVLTLTAHKGAVLGLAFSPDSRRLASGSQDGTVRVWDATPLLDSAAPKR